MIGPTISGGGAANPNVMGHQTAIGVVTGSGTTVQLGGIFMFNIETDWTGFYEDPHVKNLRISRSGPNILVEWDSDITGPFYVFRRIGDFENNYDPATSNWAAAAENPIIGSSNTDISYTDADQVGAGDLQIYYRVISVNDPNLASNKVAVGKVNIELEASGLKLTTCPFNDGKVSEVFLEQMDSNNQFKLYPRSGAGLDTVTVTNTQVIGKDFDIIPTVGFWLRNESKTNGNPIAATVTFCGSLETLYEKDLAILDLTGNPLVSVLNSDSLRGEVGDKAYQQAGKGLNTITKTAAGWGSFSLAVGDGMWYRTSSDLRYWDVKVGPGQAEIKKR